MLIDYGYGSFDINYTCQTIALITELRPAKEGITFSTGLIGTVGCGNSLILYYDGSKILLAKLISHLTDLEAKLRDLDLSEAKMPSRLFKLPITFKSMRQDAAIQRYMKTQRPYASYLPDNMEFVMRSRRNRFKIFSQMHLSWSSPLASLLHCHWGCQLIHETEYHLRR
jgi:urea carboxylase